VKDIRWWSWDYFTIGDHIRYLLSSHDDDDDDDDGVSSSFDQFVNVIGPQVAAEQRLIDMQNSICKFTN
jgi:hypothetical protein